MQFEISFKQEDKTWVVLAIEGEFAGRVVAVAEALTLENVVFDSGKLIGTIKSAWGITPADEVTTSITMLRALGVSRVFKNKGAFQIKIQGNDFVCTRSHKKLTKAAHVTLSNDGIFYA